LNIGEVFSRLDGVYQDRHQYSIEWAFKKAQEDLNRFKEQSLEGEIKSKCLLCKNQASIEQAYSQYHKKSVIALKKQKWYAGLFSSSYAILTGLEFVLSILMVLLISEISHASGQAMHSEVLSMWVIFSFAFMKVGLEKFILQPHFERLGWTVYKRTIDTLRGMAVEFDARVNEDIEEHYPRTA